MEGPRLTQFAAEALPRARAANSRGLELLQLTAAIEAGRVWREALSLG
jgi:hypothetical protein